RGTRPDGATRRNTGPSSTSTTPTATNAALPDEPGTMIFPERRMHMAGELVLTLSELRLPGELRIEYSCTNEGKRPLYVYACAADSTVQPLPHRAYTALREADEALHLSLGVPPIPKGLHVYVKVVPFAVRLRPGQRHVDYLELPVPVPEWGPYADPQETEDVETVQVRRMLLSTEAFGEPQLVRPAKWDGAAGYFKAHGAPALRVAASLGLREPLPVLKRRDDFERF